MSRRKGITIERAGQEYSLRAYASGSGALNFSTSYAVDDHQTAQSVPISEKNVKTYRDTFMPDRLIVDEHYKSETSNQWALVVNVERVDENHLISDGRTYEIGEPTGNEIGPHKFYMNHDLLGRNEVMNLSTKSSLNYFMKNEENIEMSRDKFGNAEVMARLKETGKDNNAESPSLG